MKFNCLIMQVLNYGYLCLWEYFCKIGWLKKSKLKIVKSKKANVSSAKNQVSKKQQYLEE